MSPFNFLLSNESDYPETLYNSLVSPNSVSYLKLFVHYLVKVKIFSNIKILWID